MIFGQLRIELPQGTPFKSLVRISFMCGELGTLDIKAHVATGRGQVKCKITHFNRSFDAIESDVIISHDRNVISESEIKEMKERVEAYKNGYLEGERINWSCYKHC